MQKSVLIRDIANVMNLSTPLGLIAALFGRGKLRRHSGLFVAENVKLPLINASAMTVGSVVLIPGRTVEEAQRQIPTLMAHEDEHAWQYAYCLGLPFVPLYMGAMLWSMIRSGDRASANHFELQAGLETGGYRHNPTRMPVRQGIKNLVSATLKR